MKITSVYQVVFLAYYIKDTIFMALKKNVYLRKK